LKFAPEGARHSRRDCHRPQALNTLRENWLNLPEWPDSVPTPEEEKAGYPLHPVAKAGHEAGLKKRTLTSTTLDEIAMLSFSGTNLISPARLQNKPRKRPQPAAMIQLHLPSECLQAPCV